MPRAAYSFILTAVACTWLALMSWQALGAWSIVHDMLGDRRAQSAMIQWVKRVLTIVSMPVVVAHGGCAWAYANGSSSSGTCVAIMERVCSRLPPSWCRANGTPGWLRCSVRLRSRSLSTARKTFIILPSSRRALSMPVVKPPIPEKRSMQGTTCATIVCGVSDPLRMASWMSEGDRACTCSRWARNASLVSSGSMAHTLGNGSDVDASVAASMDAIKAAEVCVYSEYKLIFCRWEGSFCERMNSSSHR